MTLADRSAARFLAPLAATLSLLAFACSGDDDAGGPPDGDGDGCPSCDAAPAPPDAAPDEAELACGAEVDLGGDGSIDNLWRYFYDQRGRNTRDEGDIDGDGQPDDIWEYAYTDGGARTLLRETVEGVLAYLEETSYDPADNPLVEVLDWDGSGSAPPDTMTWRYRDGRLTRELSDWESDGVIDHRMSYLYDTDGRVSVVSIDGPPGGRIEAKQYRTYDRDDRLVAIGHDHPVGGAIEDVENLTYDDAGHLVRRAFDAGQDGTIDQLVARAYDERGNLVEYAIDFDGDGPEIGLVVTMTYDERDRIRETRWNWDGDETLWTYLYTCAGPGAQLSTATRSPREQAIEIEARLEERARRWRPDLLDCVVVCGTYSTYEGGADRPR